MSDKTKRVEAEFEGASTCIDGFQFAPLPDAPHILVSEPMPEAKAARLCGIPGFRTCDRSADVLKAVDEQIAIQRASHRATAGDGSDISREVEELRRANHNQAADIDRLREENAALLQRIGSGDFARVSAERVELGQQVTRLEAEIATLKSQAPADVAELTAERDRLREENAALRRANEELGAGGESKKKGK